MSSSMNFSIYAIPVYYVLAQLPHVYCIALIRRANNGRWDNANPRSAAWMSSMQKTVPAATYARYERSRAAHQNSFENMPLYFAAIILGNMAKLPPATLNSVAGASLVLRALYTLFYVETTSRRWSFARTGIWYLSVMAQLYLIIRAAKTFAMQEVS
ncbi:MAG: hypothetical protein M1829_003300 [Trizodia sp. TS-e1964]|nr:MAG: hypothetical protein M1829_003300 [Trizodia sp. TS-e1964]